MSQDRKYISVGLYDAETKKRISRNVTRSNFNSDSELKSHIESMKTAQRKKNADYKKKIREETVTIAVVEKPFGETLSNIDDFILDKHTGNSTVIFGASKRGKSTLMMRLYNQYYGSGDKYISTLFTGNKQIGMYKKSHKLLISEGFNSKSEKYIMMQKYINSNTKNRYRFVNLFDDVIDLKYKRLINNLVLTYRNANISSVICLQYPFLFSKMNRGNVNNIFIFACNNDAEIKDMIDIFLKGRFLNAGLVTLRDQINFFKEVTHNYGFFYLNNIHNMLTIHRILD